VLKRTWRSKTTTSLIKAEFKGINDLMNQKIEFLERRLNHIESFVYKNQRDRPLTKQSSSKKPESLTQSGFFMPQNLMVTLKIPVNVALYISKREKKKTRKKEKKKADLQAGINGLSRFFWKNTTRRQEVWRFCKKPVGHRPLRTLRTA